MMDRRLMRRAVLFLVTLATACTLLPRTTTAYDGATHRGLVWEAFEFIISAAHDTGKYADGSTGESDYALVRRVLAPAARSDVEVNAELRRTLSRSSSYGPVELLAEASKRTDEVDDVFADDGSGDPKSNLRILFYGTVYLTTVSHFINLYDSTSPFDRAGYSFAWNTNRSRCKAGFTDLMTNGLFATYGAARLVTNITPPYRNYRLPLRVSEQDYDRAMSGQPLSAVQFWPLTHLAEHYYRAFTSTSKSTAGIPQDLGALGPVLHAAGDSTVPFHAAGISGCGHVEYESFVEAFYDGRHLTGRLVDTNEVTKLLTEPKIGTIATHLTSALPVSRILEGNAAIASQPPRCNCAGVCDCPLARLPKDKLKIEVQKLVNLAVASTVVLLRKSLAAWAPGAVVASTADGPSVVLPPPAPTYESFDKMPVVHSAIVASTPLASVVTSRLVPPMANVKRLVERLDSGSIAEDRFRPELEQAVGALARALGENRQVLTGRSEVPPFRIAGLPPILPDPARFRVPSVRERDSDGGWESYVTLSSRFYQALFLYESSIRRAAFGALRRDVPREQQERIDRTLQGLTTAQDAWIKALARR